MAEAATYLDWVDFSTAAEWAMNDFPYLDLLRASGKIGQFFENLIIADFIKHGFILPQRPKIFFWEKSAVSEVDLVISSRGQIIPVEVKYTSALQAKMLRRIRAFRQDHKASGIFIQDLSVGLLDAILAAFKEIVKPSGKIILFLDEIQNIPSWERWVRIRTDQGVKIVISGSSSKLLSSELASLLTGRHICFSVYPFSFQEFVYAYGLQPEGSLFSLLKHKDKISSLLYGYLKWGGFPEVVLMTDEHKRQVVLKQYFEDILYKDVAFRHGLKDITLLKKLGVYALTNIGNKISYNKLARELSLPSAETIRHYFSFLNEAFLIYELPRFSFKYREQVKTPRKLYAADLGMRNAIAFRFSADIGRLAENFVFLELNQQGYEIYYFQNRHEVDFYARHEAKEPLLINVAWEVHDHPTRER